MASHNVAHEAFNLASLGGNKITTPAAAATIDLDGKNIAFVEITAACVLPVAPAGTMLIAYNSTGGALAVTDSVGTPGGGDLGAADARIFISVNDTTSVWVSTIDLVVGA